MSTDSKGNDNNWTLGPLSGWKREEILKSQEKDLILRNVRQWLLQSDKPSDKQMQGSSRELRTFLGQFERLKLIDGILYRTWIEESDNVRYQLCLPKSMIGLALHSLHDNAEHLGIEKTIDKLRQRFYWFGLREDTEIHIQSCFTCQQCKNPPKKAKAPLHNVKLKS